MRRYSFILSYMFAALAINISSMLAQTNSVLSVSSGGYDFGYTNLQTTAIKGILVTGKDLTEKISFFIEDNQDEVFSYQPSNSWNELTGGYLTLRFSPKTPIHYQARLIISSGNQRTVVELAGIGHKGYFFGVKPQNGDFGTVEVNQTGKKQFHIRNEYTAKGFRGSIQYVLSGPDAGNFQIIQKSWIPDKGGDIVVEFTPDQSRTYQAELILSSPDTPEYRLQLTGIGD